MKHKLLQELRKKGWFRCVINKKRDVVFYKEDSQLLMHATFMGTGLISIARLMKRAKLIGFHTNDKPVSVRNGRNSVSCFQGVVSCSDSEAVEKIVELLRCTKCSPNVKLHRIRPRLLFSVAAASRENVVRDK